MEGLGSRGILGVGFRVRVEGSGFRGQGLGFMTITYGLGADFLR